LLAGSPPVRAEGDTLRLEPHAIPLGRDGWTRIKWHPALAIRGQVPPPSWSVATVPIRGVLEKPLPDDIASRLDGAVVVVGTTFGAIDLIPTPLSAESPGVYLYGTLLCNLLADDWFHETGIFVNLSILLAVSIAVGASISGSTGFLRPVLATTGILGGYLLLNGILFWNSRLLPIALPLLGVPVQ